VALYDKLSFFYVSQCKNTFAVHGEYFTSTSVVMYFLIV